jgi:glutamate-1-semialdehyde aminotransferase
VAAQDAPREVAKVRVEPLAAVAAQDAPREVAEVRVEPLAAVVSLVAPQAPFFLLAARLARQHKTLRLRRPKVMTFEGSRSQSLRAGSIEFVSW